MYFDFINLNFTIMDIKKFIAKPGEKISLKDYDTDFTNGKNKDEAIESLKENKKDLKELQDVFWADDRYSLLIVLQAPDAAGKDGVIKHVMSDINPQGCVVHSFKAPTKQELDHNYLWRHYIALPTRGQIGIFNRSHYENVLVTKVHPEYIIGEKIPEIETVKDVNKDFWKKRYDQINDFEKEISSNGTIILKFYLNLSKAEQKKRFLERLDSPDKNWKFSSADLKERAFWKDYQNAYEDMLSNTSTNYAPWHIIPADNKWFTRMAIGEIIVEKLKSLDLRYPKPENMEALQQAKKQLEEE